MQYKNFNIHPIEEEEIESFLTFFNNDKFYYLTKRPDTINLGMRRKILEDSFVMCDTDKPVGLAKIVKKEFNLSSEIMIVFLNEEYYSNDAGKSLSKEFLNKCINVYNPRALIYINIYGFNDLLLNHCRNIGFEDCGVLRKSVYKFGRYYETIVLSYSKGMRENE